MTLWDRKLRLILPGLAFFIFACEEPGEIGVDLNPENGIFVAKYDELKLSNSVVLYEDILSDNATRINQISQAPSSGGRLLVGTFSNQEFGKFASKAFSSIYLGSADFRGEDYIFDSLVLSTRVEYLYGEDFSGTKRIFVHELAEGIQIDSLYLTRNSTPYIADPVGEFNFDISGFDSIRVDTVFRTRLSDELGNRLLQAAKDDTITYDDNLAFRKFFNGFAFVPDENNQMVMGIHPESEFSYMRMYFHNAQDTSTFTYIFQGIDPSGINITRYYNNISLDRTGSPLEGITDYYTDFQTNDDQSYIQASAGVFTKINIGSYLSFLDTLNELVINRAEIEVPVELYKNTVSPSPALGFYVVDQNNRFVEETDTLTNKLTYRTVGVVSFIKEQFENKGVFQGNITQYIQDISSGNTTDTLLLLGQTSLWNSVLTINQTVIDKDNITLKIYYSTLQ